MRHLGTPFLWIACAAACAQSPAAVARGTGDLAHARVFTQDQGNVRTMANGGHSRDILRAALATGEAVAIHESVQMPGTQPNLPHTIQHSEFILVREGTLAFEHDGLQEKAGAGDLIYVPLGTLHTIRNIGSTPATYVVIAIGGNGKN